jgi:integrase
LRGSLRRRDRRQNANAGPDRWELRVFLGRDAAGHLKHAYRSFTGTKREAESALAAFLTNIERRQRPTSSKVRFGEYATQWLASREGAREIESSTLERYRGIIRDHLLPHLDAVPLAKLSVSDVRRALGAWRVSPRHDRKSGRLSDKSIHDHFALLKQILAEAVSERLIVDNPATFVRAPRIGGSRRRSYTMVQILDLVRFLEPTRLGRPVFVKALTGLRRGELLALRWRNINLQSGELHVLESLERRRDGSLHFKRPKTEKSRRLIVLPRCLIDVLNEHLATQCQHRATLGLSGPPDLVFCEVDGQPSDPNAFSSAFAYQVSRSGLPRISLQELRHSYSSIAQRAGTTLATTSQSMGHSTTVLTGDRYTHADLDDFRAAANRMDRAVSTARTAQPP